MRPPLRSLFCLLMAALLSDASGQTKPEPARRPTPVSPARKDTSERKAEAPLPQIELPEYDITGTLIPGVAGGNKAGGDENGALDPLGRNNLRSKEPQWLDQGMWKLGAGPAGVPGARTGRIEAGYGSFQTPWLDVAVSPGTPDFDLAIRGGIRSSAGHVDRADYRRGYASLGISRSMGDSAGILSQSTLHASAEYAARNYTPYGAIIPVGDRTLHQFFSGVSLQGVTIGKTVLDGGLYAAGASLVDRSTTEQMRFGAKIAGSQDFGPVALEGGMELVLSAFTAPVEVGKPLFVRTSLVAAGEVTDNLILRGGAAGYVARGTIGESRGFLYPLASVSWYPAPPLEIFVRFEPAVNERTLGDLVGSGPYVTLPASLQPEICGTDLAGGMEIGVGRTLRVRIVTRYRRIDNYCSFVDTARVGLWDPWYRGVSTVFSAEGDLMWQVTEADLLTARIRTLESKNSVTDEQIPYLSPLHVDGSFAHWFPFGLLVAGDAQMIGTRTTDLSGSRSLEPFVLLDVSAEYTFLPGWRVRGQVKNFLGTRYEWWEGYVSLPRTGSLGISYSW